MTETTETDFRCPDPNCNGVILHEITIRSFETILASDIVTQKLYCSKCKRKVTGIIRQGKIELKLE